MLDKAFRERPDARRLPLPQPPERGPFRRGFWRSPLRGPWLASLLSAALLPLIIITAVTGFLSHVAYETELTGNSITGSDGILAPVYRALDWPAGWAWLYAVNQGLHIVAGFAAAPLLLAKLWAVIPKLWERPAVRSAAHAIERLSLALLVGGALFVFVTGVFNIQIYYPWDFSFVPSHYYASFIFLAALAFHIALKLPVMRKAFRENGVLRPLREDLAGTRAEAPSASESVATEPEPATISRRGFVAVVGGTSVGLTVMMAGQSIGGPLRDLALLAPRGRDYGSGPNDFQVNKTAATAGVTSAQTGPSWTVEVTGRRKETLTRDELLAMPQATHELPIACVEGWSTTQTWTGVPLAALARLVGAEDAEELTVESLQEAGSFRDASLNTAQFSDPRSLLALQVNGADLSLDHGFPARVIVPGLPGVHNTKWVATMTFRSA
ncbi:MAG: molybdopterin-dependent oxidoreductase [Solirubrobacterales bacterium]|nr:molybdopterin-dependent oxidoreductase [Solirubrobacterales bacterium]